MDVLGSSQRLRRGTCIALRRVDPVSAPVCPVSAPCLPRSVCPVSAPVCPVSAPCLPRVCPGLPRVCPVSAPCLPRVCPASALCLPRLQSSVMCGRRMTVVWTDHRHYSEAVVRGYSVWFSSRCTESLAKVFRPWAGAILRTGPPFWRLGRIFRRVLLGHVLAAWLLEHLHGPRCPFLVVLLDYLLGAGFPSLFLWRLLLLGFAVRILRGGDQKTPGNIGRHDWVLRVPGRSWVQLLQVLFMFVCVLISL